MILCIFLAVANITITIVVYFFTTPYSVLVSPLATICAAAFGYFYVFLPTRRAWEVSSLCSEFTVEIDDTDDKWISRVARRLVLKSEKQAKIILIEFLICKGHTTLEPAEYAKFVNEHRGWKKHIVEMAKNNLSINIV